jgi:hypothetical protein
MLRENPPKNDAKVFIRRGEILMHIMSISSAAATPQVLNPALADRSASTAAQPAPSTSSQASSPSSIDSASSGGGSSGESASALSSTRLPSYSATVAGTQYTGSVEESGGKYTVSVPNLPGATASGLSMVAAENALTFRIDELV